MNKVCILLAILLLVLTMTGCARLASTPAQPYSAEEQSEAIEYEALGAVFDDAEECDVTEEIEAEPTSDVSVSAALIWQEAYAELLRSYAALPLSEADEGWHFILHDIDRNGIPELFLVMRYSTGHVSYRGIYTFVDGRAVYLWSEGITTDGFVFAPLDGSPWVTFFLAAGSGGMYRRMSIDGNQLVTDVQSDFFHLSEEGFERSAAGYAIDSYEWYVLSVDGSPVPAEEFERLFGAFGSRKPLELFEVNEDNIASVIFG